MGDTQTVPNNMHWTRKKYLLLYLCMQTILYLVLFTGPMHIVRQRLSIYHSNTINLYIITLGLESFSLIGVKLRFGQYVLSDNHMYVFVTSYNY